MNVERECIPPPANSLCGRCWKTSGILWKTLCNFHMSSTCSTGFPPGIPYTPSFPHQWNPVRFGKEKRPSHVLAVITHRTPGPHPAMLINRHHASRGRKWAFSLPEQSHPMLAPTSTLTARGKWGTGLSATLDGRFCFPHRKPFHITFNHGNDFQIHFEPWAERNRS